MCNTVLFFDGRWSLNLRALLGTAGSGSTGGRVCLDVGRAVWQKVLTLFHLIRCSFIHSFIQSDTDVLANLFTDSLHH